MVKATVLVDQRYEISERFRVEIKVFEVGPSEKHPTGIKVRFTLIDVIEKVPRLLIDNHEPFGFHVHEELPDNKDARRLLETDDYVEALDEFWRLVRGVIDGKDQTPKNNIRIFRRVRDEIP